MADDEDLLLAYRLASAALAICEKAGKPMAASHLQRALETMGLSGRRVREEITPWGADVDEPL